MPTLGKCLPNDNFWSVKHDRMAGKIETRPIQKCPAMQSYRPYAHDVTGYSKKPKYACSGDTQLGQSVCLS